MAIPTVAVIAPVPTDRVLAVRRLLAPVDEAIKQLQSEDNAREERRVLREHRRGINRTHQCGGCSKFLRATNEACGCGFHNDIRGRRNLGGYR